MTGKCNRRCVIEGRYTLLSGLQCPGVARHGRDMIRHTRPGERSNACYSSTDAPFLFLGPSSLVELHLYIHHPKAGFTAKIKLHPDANHMIQVCTKTKKMSVFETRLAFRRTMGAGAPPFRKCFLAEICELYRSTGLAQMLLVHG